MATVRASSPGGRDMYPTHPYWSRVQLVLGLFFEGKAAGTLR